MEETAAVYARSLFQVATEAKKADVVREQLGQVADALAEDRNLEVFFFSPYFSFWRWVQARSESASARH